MMYHTKPDESEPRSITIRLTGPSDVDELRRVAQRDSRIVPEGEILIAIDQGEIRAAISLRSGEVIADPFHRTEELVRMLAMRRAEMLGAIQRRRRGLRRLRLASS
jgi:hypothetical protein